MFILFQVFQLLRLFKGVLLFRTLEYWRLHNIMEPKLFEIVMESFLNLRFPELFSKLNFEEVFIRYLLRLFDSLAHPNLSATFATDQK